MFHTADEKELEKINGYLLDSLETVFGDEILCALIHGSAVKGGMIRGFSDLDVQVFLKESSFDEFGLRLEKSLAIQKLIGELDVTTIGASYLQMYFHDPLQMPEWYTPPVKGSYQILFGELPKELDYNIENFKERMKTKLENLNETIAHSVRGFTDSSNKTLPRRVRYVATMVFPTMYSFLSFDADDPTVIWVKPKNIIYNQFLIDYKDKPLSRYLIDFFALIVKISSDKENYSKLQKTYETGINVLKEFYKLYNK